MTSKGSANDENRLSFAKIAAMAPQRQPPASVPSDTQVRSQFSEEPSSVEHQGSNAAPDESPNVVDRSIDGLSQAVQDAHISGKKGPESPELSTDGQENGALKREISFEDDRTHLSGSSTKMTSFDSKSMASVTTFAMDEKDSLRPDDSASVQAIDEEDCFSGPASGAPNSLTGSESGARGIRDIQRPRAILHGGPSFGDAGGPRVNGGMIPDSVSNNFVVPNPEGFPGGQQPIPIQPFPLDPDEKLLEAMKSPKDRLLILQLEEKVRYFIQNSKEQSLELPPSNAFGRLLAHKLGDYYHLTHFVDNNVTSVRLHRTPFCRLPTPLTVLHAATSSSPPPAMPAMKIMRRNEGDKSATDDGMGASSSVPSKTGSEAGESGHDGERGGSSTGTPAKDRLTLTREEREAKYQAARERIFRDFPESKSSETGNSDPGAMSRSSSTSGRKKTQRQKTPHDDSFEGRSQFNAYYPGMSYAQGSAPYNVAVNDPSAAGPPCMLGPGVAPPGMGYIQNSQNGAMYPAQMGVNSMSQYPMPVSPQMATSSPWQNGAIPPQSPYSGYASINQSPGMPSAKPSPAMGSYPMPNGIPYQPTPPSWPSSHFPAGYQQQPTARNQPPAPWTSYPSQPVNPAYPYTQYPGQHLNTGMQGSAGSHPMPGSYNRSAFNPQTRSFVPGGAPLGRHPSRGGPPGVGAYPSMAGGVSPQWAGFPDPSPNSHDPMGRAMPAGGRGDSIAKWGTPSHLPPKPPPSEVSSDYDRKPRNVAPPAHPYAGNSSLPNPKNGPLVVSGGTGAPRTN